MMYSDSVLGGRDDEWIDRLNEALDTRAARRIGYDEKMQSLVIKETEKWIVSVTPMIFNDRVLLTSREEYPDTYTAGWCYDKGGAAVLAAMVWDPETEREPVGYKKVAVDKR